MAKWVFLLAGLVLASCQPIHWTCVNHGDLNFLRQGTESAGSELSTGNNLQLCDNCKCQPEPKPNDH